MQTVVLNAASNLALPLSAILTSPLLARSLGPDGRGELAAVAAPILFAGLFMTLGIPEGVTFLVASGQWSRRRALVTSVLCGLVTGTVAAVAIFLAAPALLVHAPDQVGLLRGLACLLPIFMAGFAVRGTLHGSGDFGSINLERWASVASRLVLLVVAAVLGWITVASAAWITNLTAVAAIGVLLVAGRRQLALGLRRPGRGAAARSLRVSPLLRYCSRVWIGTLSAVIILRADQVMMTPLVPSAELGLYAVAVAVAEVPTAGFTALSDVLFFRSSGDRDEHAVATAVRIALLVSLPVVALAVLVAPLGVRLVFGADFGPAARMTQIMLVATVPAGLGAMLSAGLMGRGNPGRVSIAQAVAAVSSLVLVLLLVPRWGGEGAAVASLLTYLLLALALITMFVRTSRLRVRDLLVPRRTDLREISSRLAGPIRRVHHGGRDA